MASESVSEVNLTSLKKIASGKVREIFEVDADTLLFVTTDRISAYDVVMANGVPSKGHVLTLLTEFWFELLGQKVPGLRTHLVSMDPPAALTASEAALVRNRSMQVWRLRVLPLEAIVRGYITGSSWNEYKRSGTVHGIPQPEGLQQCQAFPGGPIFTPSTKAEQGQHDENIHPDQARALIGEDKYRRVEELALRLYTAARDYADERGIILADTKFEFGWDDAKDEPVLVDEVLTCDSSRFWPKDGYEVGRDQESFDKQFLRNWLTREGLKGKEGVAMPEDVVESTRKRYEEAFVKLTGRTVEQAMRA